MEKFKLIIKENEQPLISAWCKYKWHYQTHAEHEQAFEDDKFGLSTYITFYPSGVWLTNNFDNKTQLEEKGIQYTKQITYKEFSDLQYDASIQGNIFDWESA
tara:strand:- start:371 stop:676 length:306 start_codon:yes stop_codon:yes gene_type:complete